MPEEPEILFVWAHLSDLHVGAGDAGDAAGGKLVRAALLKDLAGAGKRGCPKLDAIFVTGDVAWSGAEAEYGVAGAWLEEAAGAAGVGKGAVHIVPGNHDVDRTAGGDRSIARLVERMREGREKLDDALADGKDRAALQTRFDPYLAFASGFASGCGDLFWMQPFEVRGLRVRLVGFNTALLATAESDMGKLRLGTEQIARALEGTREDELIVVLSHHPLRGGWLADERDADAWIRNHAHLHLFGHVKDPDSEEALSGAGGRFVRIAAGAAHKKNGDHGYSVAAVVQAKDGSLAVRVWPRRWSDKNKRFRDDGDNTPERQPYAELKLRLPVGPARSAPLPASTPVRMSPLYEGPGGVPIAAVPHFLGREEEMRELRGALEADSAVCVVATGLGGIGKTSLVRQFVATEAAAMFPDGSVWIDAMNLDGDAARVCARFGYEGERRPTVVEAAQFLKGALHDRRVLVVIDNVLPDKVDVAGLPIVGGTSRTVLTSRAVGLHELIGQAARQMLLGRWSEETCRAYLREVVPGLVSAPDKDLNSLAQFVGGLPLAVRLLARLLMRANTTPERLLARLKKKPLGTLDKVATGADRGVAATFAASYEGLDAIQRRVLMALAACARVTTENVVARVVGLSDDLVGDNLADLAECSLVDPIDAACWTMHDVVRLFVRAQPEIRQADEAHTAFAEEHVEAHQDPLDWQAMEAGMDEVLTAVDRLLGAGDASSAVRLVARADPHLEQRGRYGELVERYEQLAARLPDGSEDIAVVLGNLGVCYRILGDIPKAIEHHLRDLAAYEQLGQLEGQANQLGNLGSCYFEQDEIPKAIAHTQRALAIFEQVGRLEGKAMLLGNLGICYLRQGETPKAIEYHQRARALDEKLGSLEGQATALGNLGFCYQEQGDTPQAIEHHQRALALHERLGRLEAQANDLYNLGACHSCQPDLPRALDYLQRALALWRRIDFPDHHPEVRKTLDAIARLT